MWHSWEPCLLLQEIQCQKCHDTIPPKGIFFINEDDIKNLIPRDYNNYQKPYSLKCADCAIEDHIDQALRHAADSGSGSGGSVRESIKSVIRNDAGGLHGQSISNTIREIVRQELKQILTEEAFDPNGPFSPSPKS